VNITLPIAIIHIYPFWEIVPALTMTLIMIMFLIALEIVTRPNKIMSASSPFTMRLSNGRLRFSRIIPQCQIPRRATSI